MCSLKIVCDTNLLIINLFPFNGDLKYIDKIFTEKGKLTVHISVHIYLWWWWWLNLEAIVKYILFEKKQKWLMMNSKQQNTNATVGCVKSWDMEGGAKM
jgi:predicted nucleic acid-binding protein